jgi:hypothetical protein
MKNLATAPLTVLLFSALAPALAWAQAAGAAALKFSHNDWELVCDNTRTCRAAGYQADEQAQPVSVLLTRKAGPGAPVTGQLAVDINDDAALKKLPATLSLAMKVNGQSLGTVALPKDGLRGELSAAQVSALLGALSHSSSIEWSLGSLRWQLSDKGAAAVLLKMDDVQKRLGTVGALAKKGSSAEAAVPPPLPAPVVAVAPLVKPRAEDAAWTKKPPTGLLAALRASLTRDDQGTCQDFVEAKDADVALDVQRLSDMRLLVSAPCWSAAYNSGEGMWVVNDKPPFKAELVTTSATDYKDGVIFSSQRGRGLGDCWALEQWAWDGRRFVHAKEATTGLCKGMPGGAWELPTLVTELRR